MAREGIPRKAKDNSKRKGVHAQEKATRRAEAEARQTKYDKLTIAQKLAQPHLGAKERTKLLAKSQK